MLCSPSTTSGRALEASAHIEPGRKHFRDRVPPDGTLEGVSIEQNRSRHDLQAGSSRRGTLASPRWTKPIAKGHSRDKVHRRNRGRQTASSNCRLTPLVTHIPSSLT